MATDTTAPPAADRQLAFRRSIEVLARAVTQAEQANADLEADKTPIDAQTESQLSAVRERVDELLFDGRYVGVEYDGDDDPVDVVDDKARFHKLRHRAASLGFELIGDNEKPSERGYSVFNPRTRTLLAEAGGCTLDGIAHWCAQREGVPIEQLDAEADTSEVLAGQKADNTKDETDERPEITVLVGNHCDTIFGLRGIAEALVALDEPEGLELAIAARELVKRLCGGLGCLLDDVEKRIEQGTGMTVRS